MDQCLKVRLCSCAQWICNTNNACIVVQSEDNNEPTVLPILSFPAFCPWIATTRVGAKESEPEVWSMHENVYDTTTDFLF